MTEEMPPILVVDDDLRLREVLRQRYNLRAF